MNIAAIIPARGGSKRLRGKNIHNLWGKPMIYWAIQACKESKYDIKTYASSDSMQILEIAQKFGAFPIFRGDATSTDDSPKQAAVRQAAIEIYKVDKPDIWISLQPNSPEIKGADLDEAIDLLIQNKKDEIFSVDSNLMQNAAFRIFNGEYVLQRDLSTNCGVYVCDLIDVHTIEDINVLENKPEERKVIWS